MLAAALLGSVSFAQQKKPDPPVQNVDFTDTEVQGGVATPLGEIYLQPPKAKFDCLIRVRMNFNDKLRESVHER